MASTVWRLAGFISMNKLLPLIKHRTSAIVYCPKTISQAVIARLLEAARLAPSAFNSQPWRFIIIDQKKSLKKVQQTLQPANFWAKKAPLFIVVAADPLSDAISHGRNYYLYDCGLAAMSLNLQAEFEGLNCHHLIGFNEAKLKNSLNVPKNYRLVILLAIGYKQQPKSILDKSHQQIRQLLVKPRSRKALSQLSHHNSWGNPFK